MDRVENHLLLRRQVFQLERLVLRHKAKQRCTSRATLLQHLDAGFLDQAIQYIDAQLIRDVIPRLIYVLLQLWVI